MNTAILHKELLLLLRQKRVFVLAGTLYSILAVAVAIRWSGVAQSVNRAEISQGIFYLLIGLGYYIFFTFHAVHASIRIMAQEKERGTATLLRVSPLSPTSIILQKLLTPFTIEWLLFLGTLPFLSLVFMLGGVPPHEFFYQLISLAFWLNTVILVGLHVGAKGRDPTKTIRTAWGMIFVVAFVLPWLSQILISALGAATAMDRSVLPDIVSDLLLGLSTLSPLGMVSSYNHDLVTSSSIRDWPVFPAWIAHLLLQAVLFFGAIRNWKGLSEDRDVSLNRSDVKGVFSFLHWLKRGRRDHGPFSTGWRSFYDLEEREVYRQWKPGRRTALLIVLLVSPFLALGGKPLLTGWMILIGLSVVVVTVGFSANSLKREIGRGTSIFLLASPIHPTDMVLGKWIFYMRQGLAICLLGFLSLAVSWCINLVGLAPVSGRVSPEIYASWFAVNGILLCFVPFLSIFRMADNARLYPVAMPYLVLIGLFCCAPFGLMVISAMVGAGLVDVSKNAIQHIPWARFPIRVVGWICFCSCVFNLVILIPMIEGQNIFGRIFYFLLLSVDLCILPPATGFFLWNLFCEKRDRWWREHLMPEETIHLPD